MSTDTLFGSTEVEAARREKIIADTRLTAATSKYAGFHGTPDIAELHESREAGVLLPRFGHSLLSAWDRYEAACVAVDEAMLDAQHPKVCRFVS